MLTGCTNKADEVRSILGVDMTDPQLDPFIKSAEAILNSVNNCMVSKNITLDCKNLALPWLAAHLAATSGAGAKSAAPLGPIKKEEFEQYKSEYLVGDIKGEGILSTVYGSTANQLTGGCLADASKRPAFVGGFGGIYPDD